MSYLDSSLSWPVPRANRLGHWGAQILIGAIMGSIALVLWPLPPDQLIAIFAPLTLFAVVIAGWLLMRRHDRQLCESCVAAMPLNASETAVRLRRRFAVAHLASHRRVIIPYLLVLIGSNFLLATDLPETLSHYTWAAVQSTMIYLVLSNATHRKLQPWCPQCNGGGDGDRVDSPDPMPSGSERS